MFYYFSVVGVVLATLKRNKAYLYLTPVRADKIDKVVSKKHLSARIEAIYLCLDIGLDSVLGEVVVRE